jgi:hypothetical protein
MLTIGALPFDGGGATERDLSSSADQNIDLRLILVHLGTDVVLHLSRIRVLAGRVEVLPSH